MLDEKKGIKEAFDKVKLDIFNIYKEINNLKQEILDISLNLKSMNLLLNELKNENLIKKTPTDNPTQDYEKSTITVDPTDNPTVPMEIGGLKYKNLGISNGNRGNNKGYVTDLKNNATAAAVTADENRDRRVLYEALAEQNKLGSTGLLEVQKAFADVQSEKAGAGDMVQSSSGDWQKK